MISCPYSTDCAGCISYGETLLKISNVNLSYGDKVVLKDVNAEIKDVIRKCHIQGQIVGFLGPSGIGKTSLFRIMAGLESPTSGSVHINHYAEPVRAGQVGVVAQNYPLFEHRTVWGNLLLGAVKKYPNSREAGDRAHELLLRFGLAEKMHAYPAELSGGQRQRIAILQQLLCSDHFVLMDEPFSGLDIIAKEKVCELITEVSCLDELNTIVIVSHDIAATASVSDTLWLMGRDYVAGKPVPGARIQKIYNLVDLGLCWQEHIQMRQDFIDFVRTLNEEFEKL